MKRRMNCCIRISWILSRSQIVDKRLERQDAMLASDEWLASDDELGVDMLHSGDRMDNFLSKRLVVMILIEEGLLSLETLQKGRQSS